MASNPYESPLTEGRPPEPKPRQFQPTLLGCLAVIGIVAVLIALLLPFSRGSPQAQRRMGCMMNLKQIGLALHNYADEYGALPPAYTVDENGNRLHSWRTLILPYLEQQALYETIDLSKPWDDSANKTAFDTPLRCYRCPAVNCPPTHATYLAIVVPGSCLQPAEGRKLSEISDDHGSTLLVMELDAKLTTHWMSPVDADELVLAKLGTKDLVPHPGGAQVLFVDGHVQFLSAASKPETIRALVTIDGNDDAIAREEN